MEYNKGLTEHEIQKIAAAFSKALEKKLGRLVTSEDTLEVIKALKPELQKKLEDEKLRVSEGIYGWFYTVGYGRAGESTMLTKDDLA
jgi:hypothetical protein